MDAAHVWLHDMMLERADGGGHRPRTAAGALEACFIVVMRGVAENDGYNALVLAAGLWWRDVALMRAMSRFLRQVRVPFSVESLDEDRILRHFVNAVQSAVRTNFYQIGDRRPAEAADRDQVREPQARRPAAAAAAV
jgi:glutamate dehydrogenase